VVRKGNAAASGDADGFRVEMKRHNYFGRRLDGHHCENDFRKCNNIFLVVSPDASIKADILPFK